MSRLSAKARSLLIQAPTLRRAAPAKGLTDNPAYQWWRDPTILQPDSLWGSGRTQEALAAQAEEMRSLGVSFFRFEIPWWALAPRRPGGDRYDPHAARDPDWPGYRWERLDAIIRTLRAVDIQPVPMLVYAPEWSREASAQPNAPVAPPLDADHITDALTALAIRYRDDVTYWELWNEPDHPHGWSGSLALYVERVLTPGAGALRVAAPGCRIVLGGLASHTSLEAVYTAGGGPFFDIASVHYYPTRPLVRRVRGVVREARRILAAHGDANKPLWLTEVGMATQAPSTPSGFGGHTDEQTHARFVRDLYRRAPADAIFYYQLRDSAIFDASGRVLKRVYWGLSDRDGARHKPAYAAFRAVGRR